MKDRGWAAAAPPDWGKKKEVLLQEEMEIKYRIGVSKSVALSVQGDYGGLFSLNISLVLIQVSDTCHALTTPNFNSPCSQKSEQYQKFHKT